MALDTDTLAFWNPRRVLDSCGKQADSEPSFSANAVTVLQRRYLKRDATGKPLETPAELLKRVASAVAGSERHYGKGEAERRARFYRMMASLEFLPNSPTLMNAGTSLGNLAACFTLPVGDSLPDIFEAVKNTALIQQTGGGVGFTFTHLRPAGDVVASTHGVASGPVSFMDVFDKATATIKQGGTRRGAMMGILAVDHPDILEFITAKANLARLTNFNVSVGITNAFLKAVESDSEFELRNPRTGEVAGRLRARKVWDLICNLAWSTAEPGLLFLDRIEAGNPTPHIGPLEATNPCSELPLLPFESCVLGSINLASFASGSDLDWNRLRASVYDAVRFLDDVIDASRYPLPEIASATRANRKIGLGLMGWADLLVKLGVAYDSDEAVDWADRTMGFINDEARKASAELAEQRGPFPNYLGSPLEKAGEKLRNATVTCIAPTGTLSILAGCSGGIEPIFALVYYRQVLDCQQLQEIHPLFLEAATREGLTDIVLDEIARTGSCRGVAGVPAQLQKIFPTAHDIAPRWHVKMQAAFQRHIDNSVSKTVNLPKSSTPADVADIYKLAHESGCKGVTVYRDGSRSGQVLNVGLARQGPDAGSTVEHCPDCKSPLESSGGCCYCRDCGWSKCG